MNVKENGPKSTLLNKVYSIPFLLILVIFISFAGCTNSPENDPVLGESLNPSEDPEIRPEKSIYDFANGCYAVYSNNSRAFIQAKGMSYYVSSKNEGEAEAFYMKPADLGIYILQDSKEGYLDAASGAIVTRYSEPRESSMWQLHKIETDMFAIKSMTAQKWLSVTSSGNLRLIDTRDASCSFTFKTGKDCSVFPESEISSNAQAVKTPPDQNLFGFADPHCHITGDEAFGGKVVWGKNFHPLGITKALPSCESQHGQNGMLDIIGSVANGQLGHDTSGWPEFKDWPGPDSPTHQTIYYRWLERAWLGGLRLIVNFAVNNEVLCKIAGQLPGYTCDDMEAVDRQLNYIRKMERYIDAQCGGPGKGWFRIVYSPAEARQVISNGKLAVILGIEVATIFGAETDDMSQIDYIRTQLDKYYSMGVRSIFPIHGFNNGLGGTAMFVPAIYNLGNRIRNGEYFTPCECPGPDELSPGEEYTFKDISGTYMLDNPFFKLLAPAIGWVIPFYPEMKAHCNSRGLTDLGAMFIKEMIDRKMIIEIDHMSYRMMNGYIDDEGTRRKGVLQIAEENDYPIVSSHAAVVDGKGDEASKTLDNIKRIHKLGGIVAPILIQGDEALENKYITNSVEEGSYCKISSKGWANVYKYICDVMAEEGGFQGVPLSTDFNGFATMPSPRFGEKACSGTGEQENEAPKVSYPFAAHSGSGGFDRLKTGNRLFDINYDGVANYGLIPDFIEEVKKVGLTDDDLEPLFNSAEAYVRMWEKIESR